MSLFLSYAIYKSLYFEYIKRSGCFLRFNESNRGIFCNEIFELNMSYVIGVDDSIAYAISVASENISLVFNIDTQFPR